MIQFNVFIQIKAFRFILRNELRYEEIKKLIYKKEATICLELSLSIDWFNGFNYYFILRKQQPQLKKLILQIIKSIQTKHSELRCSFS